MMKANFTILLLACCFLTLSAQEKCKPPVEFSVKEIADNAFAISLKSQTPLSRSEISLIDAYSGDMIEKKTINSSLTTKQEIFKNVKPSRYILYIKQEGCERAYSIGGIEGIEVGNPQ
jgi:hypothetical protein